MEKEIENISFKEARVEIVEFIEEFKEAIIGHRHDPAVGNRLKINCYDLIVFLDYMDQNNQCLELQALEDIGVSIAEMVNDHEIYYKLGPAFASAPTDIQELVDRMIFTPVCSFYNVKEGELV